MKDHGLPVPTWLSAKEPYTWREASDGEDGDLSDSKRFCVEVAKGRTRVRFSDDEMADEQREDIPWRSLRAGHVRLWRALRYANTASVHTPGPLDEST